MKHVLIGVIGSSRADGEAIALAKEVGKGIARGGGILLCGGLGGVMEAAAQGAKEEGGITVGVLPGTCRDEANDYIDIPIVTGMGFARNIIIVRSSHAVIAVKGESGTLSEIAYALQLSVPIVGLKTWRLSEISAIGE
ncbi:unnamed protein product, partial [marine sediment metagenome]